MDGDIKKLLELAKSAGSLTQRQKEVMLDKARVAGYDVDEVEMMIESIPTIEERPKKVTKVKRCPHCGATLSDFVLQCPECGYVFSDESQISERNRNYLADLHSQLQKIETRAPKNKDEREWDHILREHKDNEILALIHAFSVPNTKEALIQGLLGCFAASEGSANGGMFGKGNIKQAWLGKAKEFYLLLQSQPVIDSQTSEILKKYEPLISSADKKFNKERKHIRLITIIVIIGIVLFYLGIIIIAPMI